MIEWIAIGVSLFGVIATAWITRWSTNKSINNQNKQTYRPFLKIKSIGHLHLFPRIIPRNSIKLVTVDSNKKICKNKKVFFKLTIKNVGNGIANRLMIFFPVDKKRSQKGNFYNQVLEVQEILSIDVELLYNHLNNSNTYMIVFFEDVNGNLYSTKFELKVDFKNKRIRVLNGQKETHDYQLEKRFVYPELKNSKDYKDWKKQRENIKKFDGIVL